MARDPDLPTPLGVQRVVVAVAGASGGALAGGAVAAAIIGAHLRHGLADAMEPGELGELLALNALYCVLFWVAVGTAFWPLRAFVPADATLRLRLALWFGLFLPLAASASWATAEWTEELAASGLESPARTVQRILTQGPRCSDEVAELVGASLRAVLPMAVAGALTGARLRVQLGACAGTGFVVGLVVARLRHPSPISLEPRLVNAALGLVPVIAFAAGLGLARLCAPDRDPRG